MNIICPNCRTPIEFSHSRESAPGVTETREDGDMSKERRSIKVTELRVAREDGKPPKIVGHAAVFDQLSKPMSTPRGVKFREKIAPGAFKRSLDSGRDIGGLFNHDRSKMLGRTSAGTLELREDDKGLAFELTPADTTLAKDTLADIEHGNIRGMSFGFGDPVDEWEKVDGENIRTLKEIPLGEISLTPYPVYDGTDVNVRAIEAAVARLEKRAIVEVDDNSIQYSADYVLRAGQSYFDALRSMIRTLCSLGDAALTAADQAAVSDAMDQVMDVDAKIAQLIDCADGKYQPLNPASVPDPDEVDDDDDDSRSEPADYYQRVQRMAEMGLETREVRAGHMPQATAKPTLKAAVKEPK